jgi:hypothetical protein
MNILAKREISVFARNRTRVIQLVSIHFIVSVILNFIACHIKNISYFHILWNMWQNVK